MSGVGRDSGPGESPGATVKRPLLLIIVEKARKRLDITLFIASRKAGNSNFPVTIYVNMLSIHVAK